MRTPLPEEKWLVMVSGKDSFYVLVNTGDVDECQIIARCKSEEEAEFMAASCNYFRAHLTELQDIGVPD